MLEPRRRVTIACLLAGVALLVTTGVAGATTLEDATATASLTEDSALADGSDATDAIDESDGEDENSLVEVGAEVDLEATASENDSTEGIESAVGGTLETVADGTNSTTGTVTNATGAVINATETATGTERTLENATAGVTSGLEEPSLDADVGLEVSAAGSDVRVDAAVSTDAILERRSEPPTRRSTTRPMGSDGEVAPVGSSPAEDEPSRPGAGAGTVTSTDLLLAGLLGTVAASGAAGAGGAAGSAGSASGALGSLAAWLAPLKKLLTLPPEVAAALRYSRHDDSDPLEHDRRRELYEAIAAEPGNYLSALSEATEIPLSTVRHHVRVLEDEGLIDSVKVNGKRRYAPAGETDVPLAAALDEPAKRAVLEALERLGPATNGDLATALERDPGTISHHLGALEADGLVTREREGRSTVNAVAPAAQRALRAERARPAGRIEPVVADD